MADDHADMVFTDPPYNVKVSNIVGRGDIEHPEHPEFAMASGEMDEVQLRQFLGVTLGNAVSVSREGAVHYAAMDWRHIDDLIAVGKRIYGAMFNLAVWVKVNGGQHCVPRRPGGDRKRGLRIRRWAFPRWINQQDPHTLRHAGASFAVPDHAGASQ
jgi:hypothetical protein